MASRRVAKSAVDWIAFAERVPPNQKELYRAFRAKSEAFINRVHQNPESLPKIDFGFYKARLANPALADQFSKQYDGVSVPYPKDKNNMHKDVEAEQKKAETESKQLVSSLQKEISEAKSVLSKLSSIPPPEEMTLEMYAYYFPEKALEPIKRPTFWPHTPMFQPGNKDCKYITK